MPKSPRTGRHKNGENMNDSPLIIDTFDGEPAKANYRTLPLSFLITAADAGDEDAVAEARRRVTEFMASRDKQPGPAPTP